MVSTCEACRRQRIGPKGHTWTLFLSRCFIIIINKFIHTTSGIKHRPILYINKDHSVSHANTHELSCDIVEACDQENALQKLVDVVRDSRTRETVTLNTPKGPAPVLVASKVQVTKLRSRSALSGLQIQAGLRRSRWARPQSHALLRVVCSTAD